MENSEGDRLLGFKLDQVSSKFAIDCDQAHAAVMHLHVTPFISRCHDDRQINKPEKRKKANSEMLKFQETKQQPQRSRTTHRELSRPDRQARRKLLQSRFAISQ